MISPISQPCSTMLRLDASGRAQVCVGHGQGPSFGRFQTDHVALRQVMRALKMVHPFGYFLVLKMSNE